MLILGLLRTQLNGAQPQELNGWVVDSLTQRGIAQVNVLIAGTHTGTSTDEHGFFRLTVREFRPGAQLVFRHIAYETCSMPLTQFTAGQTIFLRFKPISLPEVSAEAKRKSFIYEKELTNLVTPIPAQDFEVRGFTDAADLLRSDQSILVSETGSGRKTISVRGANADEVVILLDGVKINNNFNNQFDLGLIDLSGLQQVDIIRGANLATTGSYGSAAVINLITRNQQDYLLNFKQRFGSYNSGDWSASLCKSLRGLNCFASYKAGAMTQNYAGVEASTAPIRHTTRNYLVNLQKSFPFNHLPDSGHQIHAKLIGTTRRYHNPRQVESIRDSDLLGSGGYSGYLLPFGRTIVNITQQSMAQNYDYRSGDADGFNRVHDHTTTLGMEQAIRYNNFNVFVGTDLSRARLEQERTFWDSYYRVVLRRSDFERRRQVHFAAFQFVNSAERTGLAWQAVDFTLGLDRVQDQLPGDLFSTTDTLPVSRKWSESSYQLTITFADQPKNPAQRFYCTYGFTSTVPALYQQMQYALYRRYANPSPFLVPEYKKNLEVGGLWEGTAPLTGWSYQLNAAVFRTFYDNKFREIRRMQNPNPVYDNFALAEITGLDLQARLTGWEQKAALTVAFSRYILSDKGAFPFKPEQKFTTTLTLRRGGFSGELVWFAESARRGLIMDQYLRMKPAKIAAYANCDVHFQQEVRFWRLTSQIAFSARNLLKKDLVFDGIMLYDRRFYLNWGIELR